MITNIYIYIYINLIIMNVYKTIIFYIIYKKIQSMLTTFYTPIYVYVCLLQHQVTLNFLNFRR